MGLPGRGTVAKQGYKSYINSPKWRAVRDRYWNSELPKCCYVCKAPRHKGMHLHHKSYKNLGNERLMDLVPVCKTCHARIHILFNEMKAKNPRVSLWGVTKYARKKYERGHRW